MVLGVLLKPFKEAEAFRVALCVIALFGGRWFLVVYLCQMLGEVVTSQDKLIGTTKRDDRVRNGWFIRLQSALWEARV